jgi:hypothetical protein
MNKSINLAERVRFGTFELNVRTGELVSIGTAAVEARSAKVLVQNGTYRAWLYALTYYALGRKKESDAALSELITKYHASNTFEIATIYAFRNQTDEAFEWLDRAYAQRDPSLMSAKVEPLLKNLHGDLRFAAFLKKLNFPK